MITTTTVVWPQTGTEPNPTDAQRNDLVNMAQTISPTFPSDPVSFMSDDGLVLTVTRSWPDQESAQAWVDYILANYNVTSATINL